MSEIVSWGLRCVPPAPLLAHNTTDLSRCWRIYFSSVFSTPSFYTVRIVASNLILFTKWIRIKKPSITKIMREISSSSLVLSSRNYIGDIIWCYQKDGHRIVENRREKKILIEEKIGRIHLVSMNHSDPYLTTVLTSELHGENCRLYLRDCKWIQNCSDALNSDVKLFRVVIWW